MSKIAPERLYALGETFKILFCVFLHRKKELVR